MGVTYWHGHKFRGLVRCKSEHKTLVPCTLLLKETRTLVYTLGNVKGLVVNACHNRAGLPVKSHGGGVVSDVPDGLPYYLRHVHIAVGCDLPGYHDKARCDQCFTGYTAIFILGHYGIENAV